MMERGGEEAKVDPVEERARDTVNNSQEARITAAKNQRFYGSQTIMVEETIDSSNQSHDPQENSHPMNKISSTEETTPPLPENEHPLSHSSASAAALEGVPVSEVQPEGRTYFRLTQNGWEKRRRDVNGAFGDWQKTRELEPFKDKWTYVGESDLEKLPFDALAVFGKAYNRTDNIARKKSLYERELQSLEASSNRAQFIRGLLPLFDLAITYQNDIMDRLQPRDREYEGLFSENETEKAAAKRQAALREPVRLENIMTINSRPNEMERLIEQIEKVEAKKTTPAQSAVNLSLLNTAAENFRRATPLYKKLVQARQKLAKLIQASDKKTEEIDPAIQDQIEALKKDILKQESLAQLFYRLGKNCVTRSMLHPQAYISSYINDENNYLAMARSEFERDEPRQTVIDLFLRAADFKKRAAAALEKQKPLALDIFRARSLDQVGDYLFRAAEEAQKDEPRQTVIDLFLRAADFTKRAAAAQEKQNDPNRDCRKVYLDKVGLDLFAAGEEAQKDQPRQAVIDYFLRGAGFNERAVAVLDDPNDPNRVLRATYLKDIGDTFSLLAQETQKDEPRQTVIDYFLRAVDFDERAIAALDNQNDPNRVLRATYLKNAGVYLVTAAIKAGESIPNKAKINRALKEALEYESNAQRLSLQPIESGTPEPSATAASSTIN